MTKKSASRTPKQRGAENDDLRGRLDEAEETLRAIRSGDWDALVVSGGGGEQILTLQQSELRYRRLFEAAQDGILILDAETGAITDVNPFLIKMLGYSRVEFVEKKLWEVGAFKDIEASQQAFEALQANEYIRYDDLPLRAKDHRLIQVEFVSNVYQVDGKKVIQCNIRDITARKQAEGALARSEREFRNLAENALVGIFRSTVQGEILYVNDALARMLGFDSPREMIRSGVILHYKNPMDRATFLEILQKEGQINGHELDLLTKNGETKNSLVSATFEQDVLTGMIIDITERQQADERLRFQADLLNSVGQAVIATDLSGEINYWNRFAETLYGWPASEVLGRNIVDVTPSEVTREQAAEIFACLQVGDSWSGEFRVRRRDGSSFPALVVDSPLLAADGALTGVVGVSTDISVLKQAEEQLRAARQFLQSVQDSLSAHIAILDQEGNIVQVNSTWRDFGALNGLRHSNHCIGMNYLEVCDSAQGLHAGEAALVAQAIRAVGTGGQDEIGVEYPCHAPNEQRWFFAHITSFENNEQKWVVVAHENITERKHAQAKMQRQLEHLAALSAIDQIMATNFDLRLSLSQILIHVTTELGMDAADILTLNPNSQILEFCAERGFRGRAIRKGQVRLGESHAGRVALERRLVKIPNLGAEPNNLFVTTHLMGEDFICYYGVPLMAKGQVNGVLEVFGRTAFEPDADWFDFLNTLAGQTAIAIESATLFESLQRSNLELVMAYDATIEGWSRALDLRDKETEGHSLRVTEMTLKLARAFGLSEAELMQVRWGALLHDIGKMGVPDGILLKPGPLTDEEWVAMKKHPTFAYELLTPIRHLRLALDLPYCHHEKWDGTGYPRGLKGDQIPLVARIFAVVDVWDALSSDRPYRAAWTNEKVRQHIRTSAGTHFDPQVVAEFLKIME